MHQLFSQVLGQRDLSRAGDLFSLEDTEIESCLSQALDQIKAISCSLDYLTNDNDQAVVEICITRITTAIRETGSIEQHSTALVGLWESCLEHNLTPQGENTEDTPHAKIASDITSCILQNYSCPSVMVLAVPVAVRFLQRGNRELSRNMSSYLSLAAIAKADLLAEHTEAITLSVLGGNHMLLRVLPSVYPRQPDTLHCHLGNLTAMMSQLESPEQQHLIRLIQIVAEQHPLMLSPQVPTLVSYLGDQSLTEALLGALVDVSQASPSSLVSFLPTLRIVGQQCPALLGPVAKIHGAVGIISETHAHSSLVYLVSCLGSMEHSFHHTLLLEIRALTDRYPSLLGGCGKDIYRMSNSFTAIARLLGRRLEESMAMHCRVDEVCPPSPCASLPGGGRASEQRLQVKIQAFEEKMGEEGVEEEVEEDSPAPQRRYSLSQAVRDERREMRFNRSKSLALHAVRSRSINSDTGEDGEGLEPNPDNIISNTLVKSHSENQEAPPTERKLIGDGSMPVSAVLDRGVKEAEKDQSRAKDGETEEQEDADRLFIHLRDNMETIREFCRDMVQQIPIPEQCVIDDSNRGCVAKLSFSCPLKGHYCLYAKSCFNLTSRQPHLWIHIMLLHLQSKSSVALCSRDECVQRLASLWEKTQLKGAHSFPMAMTQHTTPHRKDMDSLQIQLEEVRFFDLFGYSEEEGGWLCFMCNNPEKATVVNQEGQPLIEGKLKEKQVRWKFIKRWKTRYFTLAGNQLLFRRGKSKDELDDIPIELSKVQSVKVVAKKRRDRGLPRAFEIFTDSKTYVLKAQDEKHAEEWLQCINVAVAQARERENREATTYL
ncbi:ventricular zone-expressed PH domain-containing protein isoform X1 [Epinephelus moara]|uniref:ventricular zone-expressed PH domain-containing protein isoform X1 n=1 Tax=Epinephelus moara TaxID=300413 RepID=UPI00214E3A49|nr:ventricular zone-expressed PH domain-containing protein isoform X1 [Epinephelus moara]XP_049919960.1 ventricular zone-expressed PH domain-containing protein isoform X1 [Epinephelus moara]XP_049919968.1 ventricular zone-expressed PH domain-containing protein isoform X1 [Epinephelus moara]XP_049919976.1 ventricular zone-expressed PH domain-containing protein isoform X1 [Epinephelus moara]